MYFEKKSFEKLTQIIMKQNLFLFDIKHIEIETDNSSPANTHEGGGNCNKLRYLNINLYKVA